MLFRGDRLNQIAWWLAALLPILIAASIVIPRWVDVPVWDDWERAILLRDWHAGTLTTSDLFAPHIQHRIALPRLVTLSLSPLTHGDIRSELAIIFGIKAAWALLVVFLVCKTFSGRLPPLLALILSAVVMSPWQFQSYFWAGTLGLILPGFFVVLALVLWQIPAGVFPRLTGIVAVSLLCSACFAHGLLIWPTLGVLVLCTANPTNWRRQLVAGTIYLATGGIVIFYYFQNLNNVSHPMHAYNQVGTSSEAVAFEAFLANPQHYFYYWLRLLGSPLARGIHLEPKQVALALGGILVLLYFAASILTLLRWRQTELRCNAMPWLALGGFALASAAAVAWGRAGFSGDVRALNARYIALTQFLPAALIVLIILFRRHIPFLQRVSGNAMTGLAGFAIAWLIVVWTSAFDPMNAWHHARLAAKAELTLLPVVQRQVNTLLDGDKDFLREQAEYLDSQGWINPPMSREAWLDQFRINSKPVASSRGALYGATWEDGTLTVTGHGSIPGDGRPADAVLISISENGRERILGIADFALRPGRLDLHVDYEFTARYAPQEKTRHGWSTRIEPSKIPPNVTSGSAWILNIQTRRVQLISKFPIPARPIVP